MGEPEDEKQLDDLERRLDAARAGRSKEKKRQAGSGGNQGMGAGMRIAVEIVAAIVVGSAGQTSGKGQALVVIGY